MRELLLITTALALLCLSTVAPASDNGALGLDDYLSQVRQGNLGVKGSTQIAGGAMERSVEKDTLVAPSLFGNLRMASDASETTNQLYNAEKVTSNSYSLGIQQVTTFGLSGRLYYQVDSTNIVNPRSPLVAATRGFTPSYYDAKPVLELNLNLWRNGFGREIRATQQLIEASALATSYGESYRNKVTMAQAEAAYWRLAFARETVSVQKDSMERARKIRDWNERRVRLQLADKADLLQAEALLQARTLEYQGAVDEEAAASRAFNTARGSEKDVVPEKLVRLDSVTIDRITVPQRVGMREDVKAAEQAERAATANSTIGQEKNQPTLDLFANAALTGHDPALSQSTSESFKTDHPVYAGGVKFSMPLDFGTLSDTRHGYAREAEGAAMNYQRKVYEQERDWADLNSKFTDAKRRYQLALGMEAVQKEKYEHERDRLSRGRTVTFQVLQFEQDYRNAQLARIRAQADILTLVATLKTYGGPQ